MMGEKRIKRVMFKFEDDKWGFIDEFDRNGEYEKSLMCDLNKYLDSDEDKITDAINMLVAGLLLSEFGGNVENRYIRIKAIAYANDSDVVNDIVKYGYSKYNLLTNPYIANSNINSNEPIMRWWYHTTKDGKHNGGNSMYTMQRFLAGEIESIDAIDYVYYMSLKPSRSSDGYELEMDHRITSNTEYINSDQIFVVIDNSTNKPIAICRDQIDTSEKINSYMIDNTNKDVSLSVYSAFIAFNNFTDKDTFMGLVDDVINDENGKFNVYINKTPIIMDKHSHHSYSYYVLSQILLCDNNEYHMISGSDDNTITEDLDYILVVKSDKELMNIKR